MLELVVVLDLLASQVRGAFSTATADIFYSRFVFFVEAGLLVQVEQSLNVFVGFEGIFILDLVFFVPQIQRG